jgi:hypothetical protein
MSNPNSSIKLIILITLFSCLGYAAYSQDTMPDTEYAMIKAVISFKDNEIKLGKNNPLLFQGDQQSSMEERFSTKTIFTTQLLEDMNSKGWEFISSNVLESYEKVQKDKEYVQLFFFKRKRD